MLKKTSLSHFKPGLFCTILTAVLALGLSASAADKKEKTKAKKDAVVKSQAHKVIGGLQWTGYGVGKSHTGDLKLKSGAIEFKGDDIVSGEFILDMNSISEKSDRLVTHLKSEDFFDVTKPGNDTAKYVITKVEKIAVVKPGEATHKIFGNLTVKGRTNPLDFTAVVVKEGAKWKATGDAEIKDRTKFDIKYRSSQFEAASKLADKLIEDNIKVKLDVVTE